MNMNMNMNIEDIIKEAFSKGWDSYHECASITDYEYTLNNLLIDFKEKNININTELTKTDTWNYCTHEKPICYETGDWDGKRSELILCETITGKHFLGRCYEGHIDGSYFYDWYQEDIINKNDWLINDEVVRYMKIPF